MDWCMYACATGMQMKRCNPTVTVATALWCWSSEKLHNLIHAELFGGSIKMYFPTLRWCTFILNQGSEVLSIWAMKYYAHTGSIPCLQFITWINYNQDLWWHNPALHLVMLIWQQAISYLGQLEQLECLPSEIPPHDYPHWWFTSDPK